MTERIVAINKDPDGNVISVKTDGGAVYPLEQASKEAEKGKLTGIQVVAINPREAILP